MKDMTGLKDELSVCQNMYWFMSKNNAVVLEFNGEVFFKEKVWEALDETNPITLK